MTQLGFLREYTLRVLVASTTLATTRHPLLCHIHQRLATLSCRFIWGTRVRACLPVHTPDTSKGQAVCRWWGWWFVQVLVHEHLELEHLPGFEARTLRAHLRFDELVANAVLGVVERHGLAPTIHNTTTHHRFLALFEIACYWSLKFSVAQGTSSGFTVLTRYLETLGSQERYAPDTTSVPFKQLVTTLYEAHLTLAMYQVLREHESCLHDSRETPP